MVTYLELDILECEVKWALGSITMNKNIGGDGIPAELFKILKDAAAKMLHSICLQIFFFCILSPCCFIAKIYMYTGAEFLTLTAVPFYSKE